MKQIFTYIENEAFKIKSISLIGDFNKWDKKAHVFIQVEPHKWQVEMDVPIGKHLYQFWINDEMPLNDSEANLYLVDENKELKSVIVINEENQRLYNNEQYHLNVSSYRLSDKVEDLKGPSKRGYVIGIDQDVVLGIGFEDITGVHNLTVAWYSPEDTLYSYTQHYFYDPKDQTEAKLWFKLNIKQGFPKGIWKAIIFVDGQFIHKDEVLIRRLQYDLAEEVYPLPIGSVVRLKEHEPMIMIFGTKQKNKETNEIWDYLGCIYPQGHIGAKYTVLFNHNQIEQIEFKGVEI